MSVEQVSGSAWAECPNGVESAPIIVLFRMDGEFTSDYGADSHDKRDPNKIRWTLGTLSYITYVLPKSRGQ